LVLAAGALSLAFPCVPLLRDARQEIEILPEMAATTTPGAITPVTH
jgi:hypothetical protein